MTIRTNPPGAMVYVDRQRIGTTPVSTNFTYYGTRQFEIIKDGYRTEKFLRTFNAPWYQWPVLDFVSESLWPYEQRDERVIDVELSPEMSVSTDALIRSGEELRSQATRGIAVGPPPTLGGISPSAADLVIPRGDAPIYDPNTGALVLPNTSPQQPGLVFPPNQTPTPSPSDVILPNSPSIFDLPPGSFPSSTVTPGASFRQEIPE